MGANVRSLEVALADLKNGLPNARVPDLIWEQFLDVFGSVQKRERPFAGITVTAKDGSWLTVDGSGGLFFALYQRADGTQFQPLPDPSQPDEEVTILIGGAETVLPRCLLFDVPTALRVVWDFWHGRLDVSTGWEPL